MSQSQPPKVALDDDDEAEKGLATADEMTAILRKRTVHIKVKGTGVLSGDDMERFRATSQHLKRRKNGAMGSPADARAASEILSLHHHVFGPMRARAVPETPPTGVAGVDEAIAVARIVAEDEAAKRRAPKVRLRTAGSSAGETTPSVPPTPIAHASTACSTQDDAEDMARALESAMSDVRGLQSGTRLVDNCRDELLRFLELESASNGSKRPVTAEERLGVLFPRQGREWKEVISAVRSGISPAPSSGAVAEVVTAKTIDDISAGAMERHVARASLDPLFRHVEPQRLLHLYNRTCPITEQELANFGDPMQLLQSKSEVQRLLEGAGGTGRQSEMGELLAWAEGTTNRDRANKKFDELLEHAYVGSDGCIGVGQLRQYLQRAGLSPGPRAMKRFLTTVDPENTGRLRIPAVRDAWTSGELRLGIEPIEMAEARACLELVVPRARQSLGLTLTPHHIVQWMMRLGATMEAEDAETFLAKHKGLTCESALGEGLFAEVQALWLKAKTTMCDSVSEVGLHLRLRDLETTASVWDVALDDMDRHTHDLSDAVGDLDDICKGLQAESKKVRLLAQLIPSRYVRSIAINTDLSYTNAHDADSPDNASSFGGSAQGDRRSSDASVLATGADAVMLRDRLVEDLTEQVRCRNEELVRLRVLHESFKYKAEAAVRTANLTIRVKEAELLQMEDKLRELEAFASGSEVVSVAPEERLQELQTTFFKKLREADSAHQEEIRTLVRELQMARNDFEDEKHRMRNELNDERDAVKDLHEKLAGMEEEVQGRDDAIAHKETNAKNTGMLLRLAEVRLEETKADLEKACERGRLLEDQLILLRKAQHHLVPKEEVERRVRETEAKYKLKVGTETTNRQQLQEELKRAKDKLQASEIAEMEAKAAAERRVNALRIEVERHSSSRVQLLSIIQGTFKQFFAAVTDLRTAISTKIPTIEEAFPVSVAACSDLISGFVASAQGAAKALQASSEIGEALDTINNLLRDAKKDIRREFPEPKNLLQAKIDVLEKQLKQSRSAQQSDTEHTAELERTVAVYRCGQRELLHLLSNTVTALGPVLAAGDTSALEEVLQLSRGLMHMPSTLEEALEEAASLPADLSSAPGSRAASRRSSIRPGMLQPTLNSQQVLEALSSRIHDMGAQMQRTLGGMAKVLAKGFAPGGMTGESTADASVQCVTLTDPDDPQSTRLGSRTPSLVASRSFSQSTTLFPRDAAGSERRLEETAMEAIAVPIVTDCLWQVRETLSHVAKALVVPTIEAAKAAPLDAEEAFALGAVTEDLIRARNDYTKGLLTHMGSTQNANRRVSRLSLAYSSAVYGAHSTAAIGPRVHAIGHKMVKAKETSNRLRLEGAKALLPLLSAYRDKLILAVDVCRGVIPSKMLEAIRAPPLASAPGMGGGSAAAGGDTTVHHLDATLAGVSRTASNRSASHRTPKASPSNKPLRSPKDASFRKKNGDKVGTGHHRSVAKSTERHTPKKDPLEERHEGQRGSTAAHPLRRLSSQASRDPIPHPNSSTPPPARGSTLRRASSQQRSAGHRTSSNTTLNATSLQGAPDSQPQRRSAAMDSVTQAHRESAPDGPGRHIIASPNSSLSDIGIERTLSDFRAFGVDASDSLSTVDLNPVPRPVTHEVAVQTTPDTEERPIEASASAALSPSGAPPGAPRGGRARLDALEKEIGRLRTVNTELFAKLRQRVSESPTAAPVAPTGPHRFRVRSPAMSPMQTGFDPDGELSPLGQGGSRESHSPHSGLLQPLTQKPAFMQRTPEAAALSPMADIARHRELERREAARLRKEEQEHSTTVARTQAHDEREEYRLRRLAGLRAAEDHRLRTLRADSSSVTPRSAGTESGAVSPKDVIVPMQRSAARHHADGTGELDADGPADATDRRGEVPEIPLLMASQTVASTCASEVDPYTAPRRDRVPSAGGRLSRPMSGAAARQPLQVPLGQEERVAMRERPSSGTADRPPTPSAGGAPSTPAAVGPERALHERIRTWADVSRDIIFREAEMHAKAHAAYQHVHYHLPPPSRHIAPPPQRALLGLQYRDVLVEDETDERARPAPNAALDVIFSSLPPNCRIVAAKYSLLAMFGGEHSPLATDFGTFEHHLAAYHFAPHSHIPGPRSDDDQAALRHLHVLLLEAGRALLTGDFSTFKRRHIEHASSRHVGCPAPASAGGHAWINAEGGYEPSPAVPAHRAQTASVATRGSKPQRVPAQAEVPVTTWAPKAVEPIEGRALFQTPAKTITLREAQHGARTTTDPSALRSPFALQRPRSSAAVDLVVVPTSSIQIGSRPAPHEHVGPKRASTPALLGGPREGLGDSVISSAALRSHVVVGTTGTRRPSAVRARLRDIASGNVSGSRAVDASIRAEQIALDQSVQRNENLPRTPPLTVGRILASDALQRLRTV